MVYFNDTCPEKSIIYCVFYTGKQYKKTPEKNIPPQVLFINGEDFIKDSPWIKEYKRELDSLRDRYARGENKKKLSGLMEVYPRPTDKASIKTFIHNPNTTSTSTVEPEPEPEPEELPDVYTPRSIRSPSQSPPRTRPSSPIQPSEIEIKTPEESARALFMMLSQKDKSHKHKARMTFRKYPSKVKNHSRRVYD